MIAQVNRIRDDHRRVTHLMEVEAGCRIHRAVSRADRPDGPDAALRLAN
jgi:hypothetical protein